MSGCSSISPLSRKNQSSLSFITKKSNFEKSLKRGKVFSLPGTEKTNLINFNRSSHDIYEVYDYKNSHIPALIQMDARSENGILEKDLETFAMEQISSQHFNFGLSSEDLIPAQNFKTRAKDDLLALNYLRTSSGVPVVNEYISFFFAKQANNHYKLIAIRNRTHGEIKFLPFKRKEVSVEDLKQQIGRDDFEVLSEKRVIYPEVKDEKVDYVNAKEFVIKFMDDDIYKDEELTVTVASDRNSVIEAYSNVFQLKHKYSVMSWHKNYRDEEKKKSPLHLVEISKKDGKTDEDGNIDLASSNAPTSINLENRYIKVFDASRASGPSTSTLIRLEGQTNGAETIFQAHEHRHELAVWSATERLIKMISKHLTSDQAKILSIQLPAYVNFRDHCNASYFLGGKGMLFYVEGRKQDLHCGNTAGISDVVAHEYCHGLDDFTGRPGIHDGAFSEGIGDICASFLNKDPLLGEGFLFDKRPGHIRTMENNKVYPKDLTGAQHQDSEIISGSFWRLTKNLEKKYGEEKGHELAQKLFFKHLIDTNYYLDSYSTLLLIDDDDNNPATKSPHFCEINNAFAHHFEGITLDPTCKEIEPEPDNEPDNEPDDEPIEMENSGRRRK